MKNQIFLSCIVLLFLSCDSFKTKTQQLEENLTYLKYNFYSDANGNIYQKTYFAFDDVNANNADKYYFDSTMYHPEYPKEIALKKIIDIPSFVVFENTPFEKDKNNVYYVRATSSGGYRFIVKQADPKTFKPIEHRWGKDGKNVYWENNTVPDADVATFKVYQPNTDSAYDKNAYFLNGKQLKPTNEN